MNSRYQFFEIRHTGPVVEKTLYTFHEALHVGYADEGYRQGYGDAKDGKGILSNPFEQDTCEFRRFVDGWCFYWSADGKALREAT